MDLSGKELLAQQLGQLLLENAGNVSTEELASNVSREAAEILEQIVVILDDDGLEDFECIEEIVALLTEKGISTTRHDFG